MKKTVLIVDDEIDVLSVLEKRLSVAGFDVIKAENGQKALHMARSFKPNMILLDVMMPDMDGGEVAAELKKDPLTENIPVIFLTCLFTKADEKIGGHDVGDEIYVAKPYDIDGLLEQINNHLRT